MFKLIAGGVLGVCGLILFLMTYFTVDQYERAVVTRFGEVAYVAEPGLHFKVPLVHSVHPYRTDMLNVSPEKPVNTYTVDNQEVDVIFNLFYRIPVDKIAFVYQNVQDYEARLFNMANDRLKAEMGKVNVQHVAEQRGKLRDAIKDVLAKDAKSLGIEVMDFQLTNIEYTKSFRAAVEAAAAAKAMVETREQERVQAVKTAETVREKARGEADALLTVATAQAKALQIQNAALAQNKDVLDLRRIEVEMVKSQKWNGALPSAIYAGAPIPFLNVAK